MHNSNVAQSEVVDSPTEYEYLCVEVTRAESTDVYLKVPKGWRPTGKNSLVIPKAVKATVTEGEWDKCGWEDTIETQGWKTVTEAEGRAYNAFNVEN